MKGRRLIFEIITLETRLGMLVIGLFTTNCRIDRKIIRNMVTNVWGETGRGTRNHIGKVRHSMTPED
jgi:hypothetical protein